MKKWEAAVLIAAAFLIVMLTLGSRFFISPISLDIVIGHSMYPTLKQGDLALGISTSLSGYRPGDIVIYCRSASYCIIHRVIETGNGTITTKGDFNPIPDPPVSPSEVKYRVVLSIPAWIWIPSLFLLTSLSYLDPRMLKASLLSPFNLEAFLYTLILLALFLVFLFAIVQEPGRAAPIQLPSMTLRGIGFAENRSTVLIQYNLYNLTPLSIQSCYAGVSQLSLPCSASIINGSTVSVGIPSGLLYYLYSNNEGSFTLNITLSLDKGTLLGSYPLVISWQSPSLSIENSTLVIENRNPVPLKILNSTVYYMNATAYYGSPLMVGKMSLLNETEIPPMGILRKPFPPEQDYAYVEVYYEYMNQTVRWVGKAQFS